ncbi:hypothetical protein NSQ77_03535 [Oceanobacillus sp. FSL K6-2867]|uniref:hypothetical protein n=1 Tax=Oceanobacillus sp. FSL K6-2867 TaxID=2954748 RepID=UPI0030D9BF86
MSNEENGALVTSDSNMYPYPAYVHYPYYRSEHDHDGHLRFPFLPFLGGIAGGLLAGALIYPSGPAYYPVYQPYPVYTPYPYPPYPQYGPYQSGYKW